MDTRRTCYLFLDYDGTVFLNGKEIPTETKEALAAVQRAGHQIILNTGRSRGNPPQDNSVSWDGQIFSGADFTYHGKRHLLYRLNRKDGEKWFCSAMERGAWIFVEGDRKSRRFDFNRAAQPPTNAEKKKYLREYRNLTRWQVLSKLSVGVTSVSGEPTARLHAVDQKTYLELFPKGTDKGFILKIFCEWYGIEREQCIAFGDSLNDLAAFEAVETAVSMKGAPEELKAAATYHAETENGVAEGIRYYFPELFS